jgi:hypothetical protein
LEKAAAKENADAMNSLGWFYQYGFGMTQDYAGAGELFEKAARKDDAYAKMSVAPVRWHLGARAVGQQIGIVEIRNTEEIETAVAAAVAVGDCLLFVSLVTAHEWDKTSAIGNRSGGRRFCELPLRGCVENPRYRFNTLGPEQGLLPPGGTRGRASESFDPRLAYRICRAV